MKALMCLSLAVEVIHNCFRLRIAVANPLQCKPRRTGGEHEKTDALWLHLPVPVWARPAPRPYDGLVLLCGLGPRKASIGQAPLVAFNIRHVWETLLQSKTWQFREKID